MASRTHDFDDYSFGRAHSRPRQVWYRRDDPVELPRTSIWRAGGGVLATAAAMAALVIGGAYAAFRDPPPQLLEETPALPPTVTWRPDPTLSQAHVTNVLQGPAMSVPEKAAAAGATEAEENVPSNSLESPPFAAPSSKSPPSEKPPPESPSFASPLPESREIITDDSKMYPSTPAPAPYPNPTTTPPDAIAPVDTGAAPTPPPLEPENPYQD